MRQDKDRTAKWLLTHHGDSILRLANIRDFVRWRPAATEVVAPRRIPDGLLEVWYPGESKSDFVLVEIETYPGQDVDGQILEDLELVSVDRGIVPDVVCLVLQPKGNLTVRGNATRQSKRGSTTLTATWPVVNLWELDAEQLLVEGDPGLIPWVPLAKTDRSRDEVLVECRDRLTAVSNAKDRSGLLAVTAILAGLTKDAKGLLNLFGGVDAMIESPVLDEVKEILLKRGRIEGRVIEAQESVVENLEARFGSVPEEVRAKLTGIIDLPQLKSLVRLAATCPDLTTFTAKL